VYITIVDLKLGSI